SGTLCGVNCRFERWYFFAKNLHLLQKANPGIRVTDFLNAGGKRNRKQPPERDQSDERKPWFADGRRRRRGLPRRREMHFENDGGGQAKRDAGEELIGDSEE